MSIVDVGVIGSVPQLPEIRPGNGFSMLQGVRVIDLTTSVAGPYGAMLLGDFGAEVIKVERPKSGDNARSWGPPFIAGESLWFVSVNRNKQSLTLDYSRPEGLEILHSLLKQADVLMVNQPRRALEKLKIAPADIRDRHPSLIYTSLTGFGLEGERAELTCFDLIAEGYSGVMDLTGDAAGDPQKIGAPAADMLAGQDAAMATMAALFSRAKSGSGSLIDVALVDSMTRFLACRIVPYLESAELPRRSGGTDSVISIYQTFQAADAPLTLALGSDSIWHRFWEAVGDAEYGANPKFASNALRRANRPAIVERIRSILLKKPRDYWLDLLAKARVPAGPINRVDELVADVELQKRGVLYRLLTDSGSVPQVGTGIHVDGEMNVPKLGPPTLGAHTQKILREWLGFDTDRLRRLNELGIV